MLAEQRDELVYCTLVSKVRVALQMRHCRLVHAPPAGVIDVCLTVAAHTQLCRQHEALKIHLFNCCTAVDNVGDAMACVVMKSELYRANLAPRVEQPLAKSPAPPPIYSRKLYVSGMPEVDPQRSEFTGLGM